MVHRLEHWSLFWQRRLPQAQRNKLREQPQIIAAATRQILRGHASCQQRHKAPFPIADRLYRVLRWTKPGSLPWLLLSLLVCTPIVRAQVTGFDKQVVEILGTVFAGGPFVSILTDWSGRFQARGLDPGMYEIAVEEPSYEPTRLTLQLPRGPSRPLELYLKASNPSAVPRKDYAVSVRELRIPMKARNAFENGLQRLAKHDAVGSLTQFERATTGFPDYYEPYYHIGVADLRLGREEEAAQAFQTAIILSGGRYEGVQRIVFKTKVQE